MGYDVTQSSTTKPLTFLLVLSSDHITGATGLNPTVTISKNGAAYASPAGAVTEIGNGLYKVAGNATDTATLGPIWLHATAVAADPCDDCFPCVATNDQLGDLGIASVVLPTTPVANSWGEALFIADNLVGRVNTAQAGAASTITLDAGASSTDGRYVGYMCFLYGGTGGGVRGVGQERTIVGYVGSTKVATLAQAWGTNPDNTSKYMLYPQPWANVGIWNGTVVASPAMAGIPDVNAKNINNVATTNVTTINANVGTTQPINFTGTGASALIKGDAVDWNSVAVTGMPMPTYTQPTGFLAATFPSGTIANTTNITAGTITTVTTLTNLPSIPANWLTAAGIAAAALNGKGDWMVSYTQPTGFLAATFPSGTVANTTNITAGTITTATNLTNAPTAGDFTAAMKTSLNAATPTVVLSAGDSQVLQTGTATAGGATTITIQTAVGTTADLAGCKIKITSGTGAKQERVITGYVNSTQVVTVNYAWVTNPDATSVYAILYDNAPKLDSGLKISEVTVVDTLTTYTGNTVQTGDSFARIGSTGSGLTSLAPSATALSTAVWTAPPTGFLAATFPSGTIANTTNITAGTITTATNLTNAPTSGDFTATMKTSLGTAIGTAQTGDSFAIVNSGTFGNSALHTQISSAQTTLNTINTTVTTNLDTTVSSRSTLTQTQVTGGAYNVQSASCVLGDARVAHLDADVSSRMATYTQPTGFLAATFPGGTIANTTNITAGTITIVTNLTNLPSIPANWLTATGIAAAALNGKGDWMVSYVQPTGFLAATFPSGTVASTTNVTAGTMTTTTNLTNAPTAGDFTTAMKASLNASTPTVTVSGTVVLASNGLDNVLVETGGTPATINARQALSGILSESTGVTTGFLAVGGATTITFAAAGNPSVIRIHGTLDSNNNRTSTTFSPPV